MNADGKKYRDAIIEFLPDATFVIDLTGKVIMWNSAMELLTSISRDSILGKTDYEYALPFYGERRPMLANLIFMPELT
jgi:PAS domain S-box-containing protein